METQYSPKQFKTSKRIKPIEEKTVFNMAVYDMEAMHYIRLQVHNYFFASAYPNRDALFASEEALVQFLIVFKPALPREVRKNLDKKFAQFREKAWKFRYVKNMSRVQYEEIRQDLVKLIEIVYIAKQRVGLGFLTEKVRDSEKLLEEALQ